jgi:hypothetical protein
MTLYSVFWILDVDTSLQVTLSPRHATSSVNSANEHREAGWRSLCPSEMFRSKTEREDIREQSFMNH